MAKNWLMLIAVVAIGMSGYFVYQGNMRTSQHIVDAPEAQIIKEPQGDAMQIETEDIVYYENVSGYFAKPEGGGSYPGIILIHEWWGLNDNIRDLAEQFAKQGYVALAVDLYDGEMTSDQEQARELAGGVRGNMTRAFDNLRGAVAYLRSLPEVEKDHMASVGWCFGGGWSYEMAKNDLGVAASVMYYGQFNPKDDFSMMRAHLLGHFGENDRAILVDDVLSFQAKLTTLSGAHQIFIYPNAGHGFANAGDSDYVPHASELAWERTISFLKAQFE